MWCSCAAESPAVKSRSSELDNVISVAKTVSDAKDTQVRVFESADDVNK